MSITQKRQPRQIGKINATSDFLFHRRAFVFFHSTLGRSGIRRSLVIVSASMVEYDIEGRPIEVVGQPIAGDSRASGGGVAELHPCTSRAGSSLTSSASSRLTYYTSLESSATPVRAAS